MTAIKQHLRTAAALGALLAAGASSAAAAPGAGDRVELIGTRVTDVRGEHHRLGVSRGAVQPVVLVFLDTACPVTNRYMPVLDALHDRAQANGAALYGVLSNPAVTWAEAGGFAERFGARFPILMDSAGDLAVRLGPRVASESFVVSTANRLVYRGRIDDRHAAIGRVRPRVSSHDLRDVIDALGSGGPAEPRQTRAVGCFHHEWGEPGRPGAPAAEFTWNRHVAPLLGANCVECHREGGIAPFALDDRRSARRWSRMIAHVTAERLMPPWRAEPGFGEFRDVRRLSDRQIAVLRAWSDAGAPLGDPGDAMPASDREHPKWRLGPPDLVLPMPEPFAVPAAGDDIYRYFVIPTGFMEDRTVVALDFSPGDPQVVHHANYLVDTAGRARVEDAKDAEPGFSVFGTGSFLDYNAWGIGGWTPGADPWVLDRGRGIWLPRGADLVLEVHYHLNGRAAVDRSEIALYFAREPVTEYVDGVVLGTEDLRIPPGDRNYWRRFSMDIPSGVTLTDVTPHMHFLGREFIAIATLPDGREQPLIRIADWDFRWQNSFAYREPVRLPAGSRIDVWARYDNSTDNPQNPAATPRTVTWGWETNDEMAEFWLGFVPDLPGDRGRLNEAADMSWYRSAHVSEDEIARLLERLPALAGGGAQ